VDFVWAQLAATGYLVLLLFGWWFPGFLYYAITVFLLLRFRRNPMLALAAIAIFLCGLGYTLFEGLYRQHQFDRRAAGYQELVRYTEPPADLRSIMIVGDTAKTTVTGAPRPGPCGYSCERLFMSGRFDRVVIALKNLDPANYNYDKTRIEAARRRGPNLFRIYDLITLPGCTSTMSGSHYRELRAWEESGRCIVERDHVYQLDGARFEFLLDDAAPQTPPWPVTVRHVRVVDVNGTRDVARSERADADFPFWLPIPGIFPRGTGPDWRPGFMSFRRSYGPHSEPDQVLDQVFDLAKRR
jgi:hypothetical protein